MRDSDCDPARVTMGVRVHEIDVPMRAELRAAYKGKHGIAWRIAAPGPQAIRDHAG